MTWRTVARWSCVPAPTPRGGLRGGTTCACASSHHWPPVRPPSSPRRPGRPDPASARPRAGRRLAVPQQAADLAHRQDHRPGPRRDASADATEAVTATGMTKVATFRKIGVVGARGTKAQIQAVRSQPGVTYVEAGAQPIRFFAGDLQQGHPRPRGDPDPHRRRRQPARPARASRSRSSTPASTRPTRTSRRPTAAAPSSPTSRPCATRPRPLCSVQKVPNIVDTDTLSVGGHGTHVNGIVAGRPTTLSDGGKLQGAAPGAKLVSHLHRRRPASSSAPTRR